MADFLIQDVRWPGVIATESFTATIGHGIAPATFVLTTHPQDGFVPADRGSLVLTDGVNGVIVLPDCKLRTLTSSTNASGTSYTLQILDRRWKWAFNAVDGTYNRLDPRGKLVPWTIRSPKELAKICLDAMGERNFVVDLPEGLGRAAGANLERWLRQGENFPQVLTNSPTDWLAVPPAQALAGLAARFGRRVVYQPIADCVAVLPVGKGATSFPESWPAESIAPALKSPEAPAYVGVRGAPVRYQARFQLEAVGQEFDEEWIPIGQLSYAPVFNDPRPQITDVTFTGNDSYRLEVDGQYFSVGDVPAANAVALFLVNVNANAESQPVVTASAASPTVLRLTGKTAKAFDVSANGTLNTGTAVVKTIQTPLGPGRRSWEQSNPPVFNTVTATPRLSFAEAMQLAQRTVFRAYRITGKGPDGKKLTFPGLGELKRRQQIILQVSKVDQIVPQPRNLLGGVMGNAALAQGAGILPDFYNGYSRDQGSTVTGSIKRNIGSTFWFQPNDDPNTPANTRIYVGHVIDSVNQLVIFNEPIYAVLGSAIVAPNLTLETACLVEDPDTGQPKRSQWTRAVPGGVVGLTQWGVFDDVEYGVVARYNADGKFTKYEQTDFGDATRRANTYLTAMAEPYQFFPGETRQFIGIYPVELDGAVQQVTWEIGGGGPKTTASINTEHSVVIPEYPARRRAEALPPNALAVIQNLTERNAPTAFNLINSAVRAGVGLGNRG